jgi:hypothetical protein
MANSGFGYYPAPPAPGAQPLILDDDTAQVRDAYAFVRACEAAHPEITVRRPWSHGDHSPRWVLAAPDGTRHLAAVTDVRDALERDYPPAPAAQDDPAASPAAEAGAP